MSTKAPIYLKRRSRKGKKEKLRDLLSSDMISPPLGDFRHTIHIGSGDDDLFGDLSFLQGKFHLLPGQQDHPESFTLSRTGSVSSHPGVNQSSPLLKNALSLPIIGGVQALTLPTAKPAVSVTTTEVPVSLRTPQTSPSLAPPPKPPRLHLEERKILRHVSLPASPSRSPLRARAQSPDTREDDKRVKDGDGETCLSTAGSMLSLHLDLGPSILDDVLQIMDKQKTGAFSGGLTPNGRQEIYTL